MVTKDPVEISVINRCSMRETLADFLSPADLGWTALQGPGWLLAHCSLLSPAANPLKSIDKQKLSECGDQQQLAVAGVQSLDNGYQKEIFITRSHSAAQLTRAVNRNSRKFRVPGEGPYYPQ